MPPFNDPEGDRACRDLYHSTDNWMEWQEAALFINDPDIQKAFNAFHVRKLSPRVLDVLRYTDQLMHQLTYKKPTWPSPKP